MSEALVLESVKPQYDKRLFNEFPKKYKFRTCCVKILFWMSKHEQNKPIFVHNMFWTCICGLTDARMRAFEKKIACTR